MAATDLSLSFVNQFSIDYAISGVADGEMGPSYGIPTTTLGFTDSHGPSYYLDMSELLSPLPGFNGARLIHYNDISEVRGKLIFGGNISIVSPTGSQVEIRGYAANTFNNVGDRTIPIGTANELNTNTGAGSTITLTLPPSVVSSGSIIDFVRTSNNALRVAASGTDVIILPSGYAGAVELTSIGTQLKLMSNGIASWIGI